MSIDKEVIAARLDLIAARARILAADYRGSKLWEGELTKGLNEIQAEVDAAKRDSREDQYYGR